VARPRDRAGQRQHDRYAVVLNVDADLGFRVDVGHDRVAILSWPACLFIMTLFGQALTCGTAN
jgi:hypothetical protein